MKSPYELFGSDSSKETGGVNINYGPFEFTVARAGGKNEKYKNILRTLLKPHRRAIQAETIADEAVERMMVEAFVRGCLLGWRSEEHGEGRIPGRDGEVLVYGTEAAIKLLTDLPDLFRDLQEQAGSLANFRAVELEELAGN